MKLKFNKHSKKKIAEVGKKTKDVEKKKERRLKGYTSIT